MYVSPAEVPEARNVGLKLIIIIDEYVFHENIYIYTGQSTINFFNLKWII